MAGRLTETETVWISRTIAPKVSGFWFLQNKNPNRGSNLKPFAVPEIPKGTSVRSYRVEERNGFVYVWYHADDEPPSWLPEAIEEVHTNQWTFMGRTEHIVSCHFQEIPENGADTSHLNAIHRGSVVNGSAVSSHKWLNNLINRLNYHQWYCFLYCSPLQRCPV